MSERKKFIINPKTKIGHIHLTVSDLQRSLAFYRGILGFEVMYWWEDKTAVFLSAGGYHHHIALNIWYGKKGPPPPGYTGLFHFAILLPNKKELAKVVKRVIDAGRSVTVQDHGANIAVYLSDPDGNGIELSIDRPEKEWPKDKKGNLILYSKPLNIKEILKYLK